MKTQILRLTVTSLSFLVLLTAFSTSAAQTLLLSPPERLQHLEPEPGEAPAWPGPGEPHGMGYLPTPPGTVTPSLPPMLGDAPSTALAASVDLSAGMPPVQSQGSQGSCMAWSIGYYYKTYQEGIQHGWDTTALNQAANQRSPAYLYNQRLVPVAVMPQLVAKCQMDVGWSFGKAMEMLKAQGVDSMASFPYDQNDTCTQPTPAQQVAARPYRAADYGAFFTNPPLYGTFSNDITPLKQHLDNGDAFVIGIPVYTNFWTGSDCDYTAADAAGDTYEGGHAIAVVGYDDNHIGSDGYFKIVNSWGTSWCSSGYGWLSYDFMQQYVAEAWWMTDIPWDTAPSAVSLPMVLNGYQPGVTPPGIYGQITQNGTPVSGALVELLRDSGTTWYPYKSTLTDASGYYRFTDAATLGGGWTRYQTRFVNHTHTTGRTWLWLGDSFSTYTAGTDLNLGIYEVSDVVLDSPADPTTSGLPVTFQWTRRSFTSDDYELNIYANVGVPWWATFPTLGYANSYTLNSLSGTGLTYNTPYYWDLAIYTSNGVGWSLDAHTITFSSP